VLLVPADPGLGRGCPEKGLKISSSESDSSSDVEDVDVESIDILLSRLPSQASLKWSDPLGFVGRCRLFPMSDVLLNELVGADRILKLL
jgi:hypothetical protein